MSTTPTPPSFDPAAALANGDVQLPKESKTPVLSSQRSKNQPPRVDDSDTIDAIDVAIELTLDHWKGGFLSKSVDDPRIHSTRLSLEQAIALKLLTCSLHQQGEKKADGRHVDTNPDAIKWLLDRVAESVPAELMERLKAEASL